MIKYIKNENLDLSGQFVFSRKTFSDFIKKTYNVQLSQFMLTEAILACRGANLENSDPDTEYNPSKMIEWIQKNIPHLYSMEKIKRLRQKKRLD